MPETHVLIAGGGVAGLSLGLTLHQIGVPFTVLEAVGELKPLGVGINIQPNAVRELMDLGITAEQLDSVGVPVQEWALVGQKGQQIYAEPRGTFAGYHWPQYAMHRGKFQMLLAEILQDRAGKDAIQLDARVTSYRKTDEGVVATLTSHSGATREVAGTVLIGADGIHSNIRAQMHPTQPAIHWGGAVMWRGTTRAKPARTHSSFIGLGTHRQRMVIYPISDVGADGLCEVNWIAEITVDDPEARKDIAWFGKVSVSDFAHHFADWRYDWLDVPALLAGADVAYENLMIDRDPVGTWVDGAVLLMGDAAHAMYPTGSNGASQAIMDARHIGHSMLEHGVTSQALMAFDEKFCDAVSALVLRNRGAGPFGLLNLVNDRCGGDFEDINAVVSQDERDEFMRKYKSAAGFDMEALNARGPTIAAEAKVPL
ncbi:flavin-dependent oxidoreductase [uncultured Sulfitobacter sp.]|uniref:flavin-dependent oxidoreductase n=1 Tax=uncultured Sulfitobacter sp. TaxID=191468 RepID=UPI00262CF7E4|nr:flavin-dependent oxidoreductase [uncultured Sulfitobacter sp.]